MLLPVCVIEPYLGIGPKEAGGGGNSERWGKMTYHVEMGLDSRSWFNSLVESSGNTLGLTVCFS